MKRSYLKIILPTIFTILLFILTIFLIIIPRFKENIMSGKREMIKELTNSAWSILAKYENDERTGLLSRDEAQQTAIARIQYLRYGEESKDYFWITDMTPKMIMHPYRLDLNGQDLGNFTDPHGKKLFVEFVETVKISGSGYVDYMWQWKDDSLHIVPKLSYVKLYKPWNWVIGTGIYIEDVKKEISALTKRMIWISVGISIVIALLLFYILKQSWNIERKRIVAENDLHESKEKYRTLVEAATEGLIMVIDGKISFANTVISKLTGYDNSELLSLSAYELISKNNNKDVIDTFSKNTIKEGQFELNLIKKNGGFAEVLITSSTTMFYGKTVNILIIKDISVERNQGVSNIEYQKLISTLNVGFFKANIDRKGRFIYANETALRILGFENFDELSDTHILGLLADADDRKSLRKTLIDNGYIKNKIVKVIRKNGEFSIVAVSLVILNNENSEEILCDGIIEDITLLENEKARTHKLIAELKANNLVLEHPVSDYLSPVYTLDADATIHETARLLSKKKTDSVLLTNKGRDFLGIITSTDIQKRVLARNLNPDNPAYMIMSSPIVFISESTPVNDAIRVSKENSMNHLVVKSASGEISGIFNTSDIHKRLINSLSFYINNIEKAETTEELKQCYRDLQLLIKPLIQSEISVRFITNITTAFSDAVVRRLIDLAIAEFGQAPAGFAFICLGSEGRKEETLLTDQDNAIIYGDVPKEKESAVNAYFLKLGETVCNALNTIGYSFCKGEIMAKNPKWCQPLSVWENYFTSWIKTPEPQQLLDATIFFDFRIVYGDKTFTEKLKTTVSTAISNHPLFLYHQAYNTFNIKPPHISTGTILSDKHADIVDLKSAVIPIIMFARTYAFQNNIDCENTIDRLTALRDRNIINVNMADEIIFAYNFLMQLRFKNQVSLLHNNKPVSNILNTKLLIDIELYILKKVLSTIPEFQNKIKTDFRITT
jgi:PAS domain S-box-containing protein